MGWSRPGIQHDASEFLLHLFRKGDEAQWVSRWRTGVWLRADNTCFEVEDSGSGVILMPLPTSGAANGERRTLQECVALWHTKASQIWADKTSFSCIHEHETHVCIVLQRFRTDDNTVAKCCTPVQVDATCELPVFHAGAVAWRTFRVCALTFHIGDLPTTGHYRSILFQADGSQFVTDDKVKAKKLGSRDHSLSSLSSRGSYVIYLSSEL